MALGNAIAGHRRPVVGQGQGQHRAVEEGHQPANGPGKAQIAGAPAHEAATFEGRDPVQGQLLQNFGGGAARDLLLQEDKVAFLGAADFEVRNAGPPRSHKALGGLGGLAIFKCSLGRGAFDQLFAIGLAIGQPFDQHGQAARGAVKLEGLGV